VSRILLLVAALLAGLLIAPSAQAADIRTCVSYQDAETDCWERPRWRYEFCFERKPQRAFLQRYVDRSWRLIAERKPKRNAACPPDYPWELKVSRKMNRDGVQRFRWILDYGPGPQRSIDYFTVTRTSQ
jgi:hypothetical protein